MTRYINATHDITLMKIENFTANFQRNAINLRVKNNLTQQQLADTLKVNRRSIAAIEEGRALGIEKLYSYSIYFGISINDLISIIIPKSNL